MIIDSYILYAFIYSFPLKEDGLSKALINVFEFASLNVGYGNLTSELVIKKVTDSLLKFKSTLWAGVPISSFISKKIDYCIICRKEDSWHYLSWIGE